MKRMTLLMIGLAATLAVSACGGGGDNNNGGSQQEEIDVGPLEAETFRKKRLMEFRRARCETVFNDCANTVRYVQTAEGTTTVEECVAVYEANIDSIDFASEITANVAFDEEAARECLENLIRKRRDDVCYVPSPADVATCDAALQGTLTEGQTCTGIAECASGSCRTDWETCERSCAAAPTVVGEGEACGYDVAECDAAQNLVCDVSADNPDQRVCVKAASRAEGDPCSWWGACQAGLVCQDDVCTTRPMGDTDGECTSPPTNTTARSENPCKPGLVCTDLDAQRNGTCRALGADGDACTEQEQCKYGFYCDTDAGSCAPTKSEGAECDQAKRECADHLTCMWDGDTETDTCQPIPEGDSVCTPAGDGGTEGGGL